MPRSTSPSPPATARAQVVARFEYAHPQYSRAGVAAQRRWAEVSGRDRIHFCGAYWRWGFHEDGVWSALRVAAALGGRGPVAGERAAPAAPPPAALAA
jgi:predicted NAD/FAD-binding protein